MARCAAMLAGLAIALCAPSGAVADDFDALITGGSKTDKGAVVVKDDSLVQERPVERVQIDVQWGLRQASDDATARDKAVVEIQGIAAALGDRNRPYEAMALLGEANAALDAKDAARAKLLIDQAKALAPDLPHIHWAEAAYVRRTAPSELFDMLDHIKAGYTESWEKFAPNRYIVQTNLAYSVLASLILLVLALVLVGCLRHLRLLASDTLRVLPKGVAPFQVMLAWLLILGLPILLTGSAVLTLVVALAAFAAYMSWTERLLALVALAGLVALPTLSYEAGVGAQFAEGPARQVWEASWLPCDDACIDALAEPFEGEDKVAQLAAARTLVLWTNRLRKAPNATAPMADDALAPLTQDAKLPAALRAAASNNRAVAQLLRKESEGAMASLQEAVKLTPKAWGPHLNLTRLHEIKDDAAAAEASVQRVVDLGGDRAARFSQQTTRAVSTRFYLAPLPSQIALDLNARLAKDVRVGQRAWSRFGGIIPLDSSKTVGMIGAGLLVLLALVGLALRPSHPCPRCGTPMALKRDDIHEEISGVCRRCHDYQNGSMRAYQLRVKHEQRMDGSVTRRRWMLRIGNVLVPGLGAVTQGWGVAALLTLVASVGVGLLLGLDWPLPDPWGLTPLREDGRQILGAILVALAWLTSVASLFVLQIDDYTPPTGGGAVDVKARREAAPLPSDDLPPL